MIAIDGCAVATVATAGSEYESGHVVIAWAHGEDPWPARPAVVVAIGSRRRPELIQLDFCELTPR